MWSSTVDIDVIESPGKTVDSVPEEVDPCGVIDEAPDPLTTDASASRSSASAAACALTRSGKARPPSSPSGLSSERALSEISSEFETALVEIGAPPELERYACRPSKLATRPRRLRSKPNPVLLIEFGPSCCASRDDGRGCPRAPR